MRIDVKKLYDFVKKSSMGGSIPTTYIEISKDGLHSRVKNINNVCMTDVRMNMEILDNDMYGRLYIKNADTFMKMLKTFTGEVDITKDNDYIINIKSVDGNRSANIIMGSELIVDNIIDRDLPKIPTVRDIVLEKGFLSKSLSDISLLKMNELNIKTINNKLNLSVGSENESDVLVNSMNIEDGQDVNVSIGSYLKELVDSFDSNSTLTLSIGSDMPVVFNENGDGYEFLCLIAPIITK